MLFSLKSDQYPLISDKRSATEYLLQCQSRRANPVIKNRQYRKIIMSLLANLINQEKKRRVVADVFSSDPPPSLPNVEAIPEATLNDKLDKLERMIIEEKGIDKVDCKDIIAELEEVARKL